jgi:hypothetical protein
MTNGWPGYQPPRPAHRNPGGRPRTNHSPNSTAARGYGSEHQKQRAAWKPRVETGLVACALCGEPIRPRQRWHLAHADHPDAHRLGLYSGPAHAACNNATNRRRLRQQPKRAKALDFFNPANPEPPNNGTPTG